MSAMTPQVVRFRLTTDQYEQMIAAGILTEEDRVELINGEILEMSPINVRHAACVKRLNALFSQRLVGRAIVGVQDPVRLDGRSEPEPDLTLLRVRADYYVGGHPEPEDIMLVVEVSDTTLAFDRDIKLPLYAAADIQEVWLVNLVENRVEVYRSPSPDGYRSMKRVEPGAAVSPLAFPDLELGVGDFLS
jgi:Uma2 family endonuclease